MRGIITIDIKKCMACKSCELACAVAHSKSKNLVCAMNEEPLPRQRVSVEVIDDLTVPLQCRHCEEAPCVKICPSKALEKPGPEHPVIQKKEHCIGCKWCILVCPFGVIGMDREGKTVVKCDMCIERLEKGQVPSCVEACPTNALQFKSVEEVSKDRKKDFLVEIKTGYK